MSNLFEGLCGKIAPGLCRFSIHGNIAVKTSSGYRAYDPDKRTLTNCDHFAFDVGDDFFFVVPTNKVSPGDIILAGGKPKCVLKAEGETITAINYEDATVETLLPERYVFMGSTYLYGKIVSMFGKNGLKGKKGMSGMMKYMMLTSLMKGGREGAQNLLPLMMMGGKMDFMDDLFDEEDDNEKEA
ncbi:MAG: hypothetical protein IKK75_13515 [Clostridia bacterium]|nr:hypothetical protein [Clostridia bacterium]